MGNMFGGGYAVGGKIQHTVFFKFPEVARGGDAEAAMAAVVAKFDALPGVSASFASHGTKTLEKAAQLAALDWPDKTDGFTHCLLVVADDVASLKAYLHSDLHLKDWMAAVKPHIKGIVVSDSKLALDLDPSTAELLHPVLFKLADTVDEAAMAAVVDKFNAIDGIAASVEKFLGNDFLKAVDWPDKAGGYTYCLTVAARDSASLKAYLHSDAHIKEWVPAIAPHFNAAEGTTPLLVFDVPLELAAAK